jgi:outer membrane protein assembly factor BamB
VARGGRVFISSDYDTGAGLVEVRAEGSQVTAREVYFTREMRNHHSSSVLVGEHLCGFSSGILTAMKFDTGEVAWKDRSVGKGSLVYADGMLYCLSENGVVGLVEATPEGYREHGRFRIEQDSLPTRAHPVVADGRLFIRDQNTISPTTCAAGSEAPAPEMRDERAAPDLRGRPSLSVTAAVARPGFCRRRPGQLILLNVVPSPLIASIAHLRQTGMFFMKAALLPTFARVAARLCRRVPAAALVLAAVFCLAQAAAAAPAWTARLDGDVRFYQLTELGVLVVGTEKSLYGVEAETGQILWRRKDARLAENEVAAVAGTDVLLVSAEQSGRSRLYASDLLTGEALWRTERVRGAVMQTAFDPETNLLAVVLVRDASARARSGFKRKPRVHVFDLATGREVWDHELGSEIEMMPARWGGDGEVAYTLDNYRPPAFLDGRLYLFYEGVTSLEAATGRERRREKFRVNEEGLALTDAEPLADEQNVYLSGRGRLRAVSRRSGEEVWEAKDLGTAPEVVPAGDVLYVRTGGRFTRLEDGETVERGPYGVSAVERTTGRVLWRFKGADKGVTNLVLPDAGTIAVADRDDLLLLDSATGKRRRKMSHKVEGAAFVLLNERGEIVVGGRSEVAAFDAAAGRELWRERHTPPGRGIFRTVGAIAARAAALYFRYGGAATSIYGAGMTVARGARLAGAARSLSLQGLAARADLTNLTGLAASRARSLAAEQFKPFGTVARAVRSLPRNGSVPRPSLDISVPRPSLDVSGEVEERLLDRLDPANQLEKLSRFLWRRRQLAALRGDYMYFYTSLRGGSGLVGVNLHTGEPRRSVRLPELDARFISDEAAGLLYTADDRRLLAFRLDARD